MCHVLKLNKMKKVLTLYDSIDIVIFEKFRTNLNKHGCPFLNILTP
jgi:hypothetical protein